MSTSAAEDGRNVPEVTTSMKGFLKDFSAFQADIKSKFHKQEERLTMLDRKTMTIGRPALSTSTDNAGAPHQKAFEGYLRSGNEEALRDLDVETKGMSSLVEADGGFLVDPQTAETIMSVLLSGASVRAISNVVTVESSMYEVLIDASETGSGWTTEASTINDTTSPQLSRIQIPLHELSAMPKVSQRLLDDSAFDIDGWLAARIAGKFARAEAAAFINGDGIDKPRGFLTHSIIDDASWAWESLGYVASGADGDFGSADSLIDLVYALGAEYRAGASFVMNSKTAGAVRKLKDADGRFLWSDGLANGEPARLLGYPVMIAEDMPDISSDSTAIAFGDFGAGYTVVERPDLRVLRDPFSAKPHVLFYATKRVGGDVSDFAAIKLLKFSVS